MENKELPVRKLYIDKYKYTPSSILHLPKDKIKGLIPFAKVYYDDDPICEIITQEISLGLLSIFIHRFIPKTKMLLIPFAASHIIALHHMLGKQISVQTYNGGTEELVPGFVELFNIESKYNMATVEEGMEFDSIHVNIDMEKIPLLVNRHPELSLLQQDKVLKVIPRTKINQAAYEMNEISIFCLRNVLYCDYVGPTAKFFLYSQALVMLMSFVNRFHYKEELKQMPDQEDEGIIRACFNYVRVKACKQLSLRKLAERFNIPGDKLQAGFKAIYGLEIREYQLMMRMNVAFKSLCKGYNLNQVAKDTGYSSIKRFQEVFTHYFGCSPECLNNVQ